MIFNDKFPVSFTMPDPKKADMFVSARPPELNTAADRDGTSVVVSFSRSAGTLIVDNTTPLDADKLEMIRRQLSEGGFKIDARVVADRMINDQKAMLG
jgi:anti-sigma28 factor (negative regulator of flagellin synthesis)